ncbi:serine/threonine-protein kinase STY17-like protein [Tanacetum coccineum]
MARPLFNQIVIDVSNHDPFFCTNMDCAKRQAIYWLLKYTSAIRQLAYGVNADFLDEYMQISERTSRTALDHFCQAVMEIYGPEFLRKPRRAPEIPFVANGVTYRSGYYLVDGIYPELAPLIKTNPEPSDDDHKRILYKQKQESARKDVERAFGVLKKKWAILEAHQPDDMLRNDEQVQQVMRWIRSSQAHQNLRHDLIEHLSRNV